MSIMSSQEVDTTIASPSERPPLLDFVKYSNPSRVRQKVIRSPIPKSIATSSSRNATFVSSFFQENEEIGKVYTDLMTFFAVQVLAKLIFMTRWSQTWMLSVHRGWGSEGDEVIVGRSVHGEGRLGV
jgi:hypothetical protein